MQGDALVVRALRDLPAGTELLHCYGPQAGERVTPLRRQLLQQQYHFPCMCAGSFVAIFASNRHVGQFTAWMVMTSSSASIHGHI